MVNHDPELERAVLCGMVLGAEGCRVAAGIVAAEDFYLLAHRRMFTALLELAEQGPPDSLLLTAHLRAHGQLEPCGGPAGVARVLELATTAANIAGHCYELRRLRQLREITSVALGLSEEAQSAISPEELARRAELAMREIAQRSARSEPVWIGDEVGTEKITGLPVMPTGFPSLDRDVRIRPGNLVTVGARTGVGKTAMLLTMGRHAALSGWQVLIFSLEMTRPELRERAEQHGPLDLLLWVQESLNRHDTDQVLGAIAATFVRHHADRPTAIMIDYLQLVKPSARCFTRREAVAHVVRELKALALTLRCPVIMAAQLSRAADDPKRPPRLSDLKETGEIEEASDAVLLLHRPDGGEASMKVKKNRHGPGERRIDLTFFGEQSRFVERAEEEPWQ